MGSQRKNASHRMMQKGNPTLEVLYNGNERNMAKKSAKKGMI